MQTRLVIFIFLLLGALMLWYPSTVKIGYTKLVRSGMQRSPVKLDFQRLSELQGCRFVDLLNDKYVRTNFKPSCFRKPCLMELGKQAGVDYVLGGSLERINAQLIISWRLMEVVSGEYKQIKVTIVPYEANELEKQVNESLIAFIESWQNEKHQSSLLSRTRRIISSAFLNV